MNKLDLRVEELEQLDAPLWNVEPYEWVALGIGGFNAALITSVIVVGLT